MWGGQHQKKERKRQKVMLNRFYYLLLQDSDPFGETIFGFLISRAAASRLYPCYMSSCFVVTWVAIKAPDSSVAI